MVEISVLNTHFDQLTLKANLFGIKCNQMSEHMLFLSCSSTSNIIEHM